MLNLRHFEFVALCAEKENSSATNNFVSGYLMWIQHGERGGGVGVEFR